MQKDVHILQAIADRFDYSLSVVEKVFDKVRSYDETFSILSECTLLDANPLQAAEQKAGAATMKP
jgi:hypothetical protein